MTNPISVLLVELLMSVDRIIESAKTATPIKDQWAPSTILGHVSDVDEQVWLVRLAQMVAAHRSGLTPPTHEWWEPNAAATAQTYSSWTIEDASARLMAQRISLLMALRDLSEIDWQAKAVHETLGEMDVRGFVIQVLSHDEEHRSSLVYSNPDLTL